MRQAERSLAAACATRVRSIISIFFEAQGNQGDAFPAIDGVEASWRELGGLEDESALRLDAARKVGDLRTRLRSSEIIGGLAVDHALGAAESPMREWSESSPKFSLVFSESVSVALEFDRSIIDPPEGHNSWVAFELIEQAALASQIFRESSALDQNAIFDVRMKAGSGSMSYRTAFKKWIRS
ncbi:hypothetical protein [Lentzea jiangxiensis]|uniref:hypothetical protein n=1 Tax=Lentzea jiangxiensis TaxID=641025 RepID=UPI00115FA2A5|nr:hypothetical protein [Lentzea jiangxiensis]